MVRPLFTRQDCLAQRVKQSQARVHILGAPCPKREHGVSCELCLAESVHAESVKGGIATYRYFVCQRKLRAIWSLKRTQELKTKKHCPYQDA